MKLNPLKYAFSFESGKFLSFMVSKKGTEANPEKVEVKKSMPLWRKIHEVQKLANRVAALNHYIARSINRCLPFFKVLRKAWEWDAECSREFNELKDYLAHPPLFSQTKLGEILTVYLAVTLNAMFAFIIRSEGGEK